MCQGPSLRISCHVSSIKCQVPQSPLRGVVYYFEAYWSLPSPNQPTLKKRQGFGGWPSTLRFEGAFAIAALASEGCTNDVRMMHE